MSSGTSPTSSLIALYVLCWFLPHHHLETCKECRLWGLSPDLWWAWWPALQGIDPLNWGAPHTFTFSKSPMFHLGSAAKYHRSQTEVAETLAGGHRPKADVVGCWHWQLAARERWAWHSSFWTSLPLRGSILSIAEVSATWHGVYGWVCSEKDTQPQLTKVS